MDNNIYPNYSIINIDSDKSKIEQNVLNYRGLLLSVLCGMLIDLYEEHFISSLEL